MKAIGLKAYRFSISWPRIFPEGNHRVNRRGLDFYDALVDQLCDSGIIPFCTLYHWDLPEKLQENGGWENRDTCYAFADYAGYIASRLSDRIRHFVTLNEIRSFITYGYQDGRYAPGLRLGRDRVSQATHHALLAHGFGVLAIRHLGKNGTAVGVAENIVAATPIVETVENIAAASLALREENAPYLTAILEGAYTHRYMERLGKNAPRLLSDDMRTISAPLDFVGLNIYQPTYVNADEGNLGYRIIPNPASFPHMESKWLTVGPEVIYWAPLLAFKQWNITNIYITENGASSDDTVDSSGHIFDIDRVSFLKSYIREMKRSIGAGTPIRGYFLWSLLDNFEWDSGYTVRFGLVFVDFDTQQRILKSSAFFYRRIISRNGED